MPSKTAEGLLSSPNPAMSSSNNKDKPEAPVSVVLKNLTETEGKKLEVLTRTNPALANAAQIGYIFSHVFGSKYVAGRVELIERLAISMDGKGREEQISALQAGGSLPDTYFDNKNKPDWQPQQ